MSPSFRRIALIGRTEDERVTGSMLAFARHLLARGLAVLVDRDCALPEPAVARVPETELAASADLIVAIGGDGTMLHAAQLVAGRGVPLLGINRGRLGFLADVPAEQMLARFDDVLDGRYVRDERTMLAAELVAGGGHARRCFAMNDVVVQKHGTGRMIELETWIDGAFVNAHGGDGLVIATSTGSTAYALSCGGPIIHPALDAFVLAPICPHTLSDRPIVVPRDHRIEIRLVERAETGANVTFDGQLLGELEGDACLVIGPASERVTLIHPPGHDYYRILRSKLHWGRSGRNGGA
jgi:NAD+ kinase